MSKPRSNHTRPKPKDGHHEQDRWHHRNRPSHGRDPAMPRQTGQMNQSPPPGSTAIEASRADGGDRAGRSLLSQFHTAEPPYRRSLFRR